MRLGFALMVFVPFAWGADLDLPGCEARGEVRHVLATDLDFGKLFLMKFADATEYQDRVLNDLAAKYPHVTDIHERMIDQTRFREPERFPELQERYRKQAIENQKDAFALYVAAYALFRTKTPDTIRLASHARAIAPQFAPPLLLLARAYMQGKFEDKATATAMLERYFELCPASTRAGRELMKVGTPELRARNAAALRAKLQKQTDPVELRDYGTLWSLEFSVHPPADHIALRKQVAEDVRRLEKLNPKPDSYYFYLLRDGYKQSGASKEALTALDDRILREAGDTEMALIVEAERWRDRNRDPEDQKDLAAWRAHKAKHQAARNEWARRIPDARRAVMGTRFYTLAEDAEAGDTDVLAALDAYVENLDPPRYWNYSQAANALLERKLAPSRAIALLRQATALYDKEEAHQLEDDTLSDSDRTERQKQGWETRAGIRDSMVKAALLMNKPDEVAAIKSYLEGPIPTEKQQISTYWQDRARLALLEGRKADALAYYQSALKTRVELPVWREGRLQDDLGDEAKALWKELGGTDIAYQHWSTTPEPVKTVEGQWERPNKELSQFELADLSGKIWKLKQLEGKAVLISVWATWCGPCQDELPKLQKLYETLRDRAGIQVLSLNIDDSVGLVAPFVAEKKYTFPVLLGYEYFNRMYDSWMVPQNWLVDGAGKWRWVQIGYDSAEPDWVNSMVQRLEDLKKPDKSE